MLFSATWVSLCPALVYQFLLTAVVYLNAYLIGKTLRACSSGDEVPSNYLFVAPVSLLVMKIVETVFGEQMSGNNFHVAQVIRGFVSTLMYQKVSVPS